MCMLEMQPQKFTFNKFINSKENSIIMLGKQKELKILKNLFEKLERMNSSCSNN